MKLEEGESGDGKKKPEKVGGESFADFEEGISEPGGIF